MKEAIDEKKSAGFIRRKQQKTPVFKRGMNESSAVSEDDTHIFKCGLFIADGGDSENKIVNLKNLIRDFTNRRKWEPYHNPKDLALSISIEAAELLEVMQWREHDMEKLLTYPDFLPRVKEELADVLIYAITLANVLDLDISEIIRNKVDRNEDRFPIGKKLQQH